MTQSTASENSTNDQPTTPPTKGTAPPCTIISDAEYFREFEWEINNPPPVIPTGFPQLDKTLKGGFRPGLYGLGAISSLGKTTYSIQVMDFIAASGRDVLLFTLEMTRKELIAKSISRVTTTFLEEHFHKTGDFSLGTTATDILDNKYHTGIHAEQDAKTKIYTDASNLFRKSIAPNRFIIEPRARCSYRDIQSIINTFMQERCDQLESEGKQFLPPVIMVDYLQVIAPDDNKDVRQHIDYVVLSLKIIAKRLQTPIFVVSSFNRFMYGKQVSYESFKESGGIEYTADCLLGFNPIHVDGDKYIRPGDTKYDYNVAKARNPRIVELVVLKNRYGETTGENGIFYEYFPAVNYFRELSGSAPAGVADSALETERSYFSTDMQNDQKDRRKRTSKRKENSVISDGF